MQYVNKENLSYNNLVSINDRNIFAQKRYITLEFKIIKSYHSYVCLSLCNIEKEIAIKGD